MFLLTMVDGEHMCVCVFFPFILDIKFVGRTSRGHTGGRSHRIFHPPSFCGACLNFSREKERHNRVHPGHFATQQGTPFYPAGMSAADWSTLVFTLPRRKMAWVQPTMATFFQNCTLILDKYPVVSENETLPRPFLPQKSLSDPKRQAS